MPDIRPLLPLEDDGLRLRAMTDADALPYALGSEDPLVKTFAHLPLSHYSEQLMRTLIATDIEQGLTRGNLLILTLAETEQDRFIGSLVLYDISQQRAEVGYWLLPFARGLGLAAKGLALAATLAKKMQLCTLDARTSPDNTASARTLLKAGFKAQGPAQKEKAPSGELGLFVPYRLELHSASE
ncbi:GNAT family N-acetyltransferase [Gallaecimonas mangrovi]|uniref:GNAT family N-acetyltransferase n=1 Tax=Gallaecimonas mangrovi TaxID=2291597 RepID=UPI0012602876|nr:GNAT family protein [Gallaecimonas mangrovi]